MQVNGKRDNFDVQDFIALGKKADLSQSKVKTIIKEIVDVVSKWENYFEEAEVPDELVRMVRGNLRLVEF